MNILDYIKADHDDLKRILGEIKATSEKDVEQRKRLFRELQSNLIPHAKSEEAVLYQRLKGEARARAKVLEGYEEHYLADHLIAQLSTLDVSSERWTAKFEVLRESLEHHMKEEERDIFDEAKKTVSMGELGEMGLRMQAMKREIQEEIKSSAAA